MGLQSAISHLTGTTPNVPTTSHRKWSKYVPSKKVFSAKERELIVNAQQARNLMEELSESVHAMDRYVEVE